MKSKTYEEFVEKFKPKKTTDDCYTPPEIYETIKDWACKRYGINPDKVIRPFWPGADYKNMEYPDDCVVLDNPPFSILNQICTFYLEKEIPFFLFAPSLTCFNGKYIWNKMNHIICDCSIVYENGAKVKTSFVTSYDSDMVAETSPELTILVNDAVKKIAAQKTKQLPKYDYPDNIITSAMLQKLARYGVKFCVNRRNCTMIRRLDSQKADKKGIFGSGLLLSEKAAAEKAAARKYTLSEREMAIVKSLGTVAG